MATPTIYKLTALVDLRYGIKEKPTPKTGYALASGDSIFITKEALGWIRVVDATGKRTRQYEIAPR